MSQWLALKCITPPQWVNDNVCIWYGHGLGAELATSLCRHQCTKMACGVKHYSSMLFLEINDSDYCGPWPLLHEMNMKYECLSKTTLFDATNGNETTNSTLISKKIYNFFINIGPTLSKSIPGINMSPMYHMGNKLKETLLLSPVDVPEITKITMSLKNSASGYHDINATLLKFVVSCIAEPLCYVCNLSLFEGIFPKQLKIANVVPLYKADDSMAFDNYRPVSILCALSKVFVRVIYERLLHFLNEFNIVYKFQFGFRKDCSIHMALITLMDKLTTALENGEFTVGVFWISVRPLMPLITKFCSINYITMVYVESHFHGLKVICLGDINLLHIMV